MSENVVLSPDNQRTLMLAANQKIEESAELTAKRMMDGSIADAMIYPPHGGLTSDEAKALAALRNVPNIESAIRKLIADASAKAFFNFFNILDGTGDPIYEVGKWTWATLLDHPKGDCDPYSFMLHNAFFDAYWAWRKARGDKGWALDRLSDQELPNDVWSSYSAS